MLVDIHHLLIGVLSSGKSTFAKQLAQLGGRYCIDEFAQSLRDFPPDIAEGFLAIQNINLSDFSLKLSESVASCVS